MTDAAAITTTAPLAAPPPKVSWVQQWIDRAKGDIQKAPPATAAAYMRETATTVGEYAEGGAVGALLGAAHAKWGLDTAGGPIDGWISAACGLGSVLASGHFPKLAERARRVGTDAFTVLSFRKGYGVVKHHPLGGGVAPGGVERVPAPKQSGGVDAIEEAAKKLG